jgi:hypothetical protein
MKSLRRATSQQDPPTPISTRALSRTINMRPPVSLSGLMNTLLAPVSFSANVVTPAGTALGGSVNLTVFSDGRYAFKVNMHDSGFDPYTFRVRCALQSPGGVVLVFQVSGHVDGTGSNLLGHVNRDFDHNEEGQNKLIANYWMDVRASSLSVSKSYEDAGALHAIEEIAKDLLGFLVADVTFGAGLAIVIAVSAEIADSMNASFVGPGGLVGVVVAGGVVWVFGPSAIIAAVVAGVAAGAITDALVKHRQLTAEEYRFANTVFGGTLPARERLFVTNLSHGGGRKYTWPELDGSVVLNLDDAFADPMHFANPQSRYPTRGQVFIHELAHAWQIKTEDFIPGLLCKAVFETGSYEYGLTGQAWHDFGLEQQASIVDQWFGKFANGWNTIEDVISKLGSAQAAGDPRFRYIANNIRLGQN